MYQEELALGHRTLKDDVLIQKLEIYLECIFNAVSSHADAYLQAIFPPKHLNKQKYCEGNVAKQIF